MKINKLNMLDLSVYESVLENGLHVYIVPKSDTSTFDVKFVTKFGSSINTFTPILKSEMITVPDGIAHFLEHKVFEQDNGEDAFTYFSKLGIEANAFTNKEMTAYLFSGSSNFKDALVHLLNYVQSPYFTDQNVTKEKGIIKEELEMYEDNPDFVLGDKLNFNTFQLNPYRISVGGTTESIMKITKENLYDCYNTFYHPSNMFIVITGNVDPLETIQIIKENQDSKHFEKPSKTEVMAYNEPIEVYKDYEEIKMNILVPKVGISIKFDVSHLKNFKKTALKNYLNVFFDIKLGKTSSFYEAMTNKNILTLEPYIDVSVVDNFMVVDLVFETFKCDELFKEFDLALSDKTVLEQEFNRKIKALLASYILASDSAAFINYNLMLDIINNNEINYDKYNYVKNMNKEDLDIIINSLSFSKQARVVIKPLD